MKRVLLAIIFALAVATAQVLAAPAQSKDVLGADVSEKANNIAPRSGNKEASDKGTKAPGKSKKSKKQTEANDPAATSSTASATPLSGSSNNSTTDAPAKAVVAVPGESVTPNDPATKANTSGNNTSSAESAASALTGIYRIGIGDVLDIRLLNAQTRESTLYTVLADGMLEYPLAGDPLQVTGLTTDEIDARLTSRVKLYDKPEVVVSVREYASHNVIITGLVNDPGTKALRREAVPLYVVLAEAQPRPEAGRASIMRAGNQGLTVDLSDTGAANTLIYPGDVIRLLAALPPPPQFIYIGGPVASPGQKEFHTGLTLTQAILVAGGTTRFAGNEVKVSRQGKDGLLVTTKYNLKKIEDGKAPDPVLQAGDRLEISRGGW
jgi:polysaccharide export outer membrane protein